MNKYQKQIDNAKSIKPLQKVAKRLGVGIGNMKNLDKIKAKLTRKLEEQQAEIKTEMEVIKEKLQNSRTVQQLNRARRDLKSVEDGFRYLNKTLRSDSGEYQSLYELNMILDTFKNIKGNIKLADINKMERKLKYNKGQFLDVINMKLAKFDLNTYSDLLKFYGFSDKEIQELSRKFNNANIKRKDHFLKIINYYAKGKNKYQAMDDDIDHTIAKENFKSEFDMRIIGGVNGANQSIDEL